MNVRQSRIGWAVGKLFDAIQFIVYFGTALSAFNYLLIDNSGVALLTAILMAVFSAILMGIDHVVNSNGNC